MKSQAFKKLTQLAGLACLSSALAVQPVLANDDDRGGTRNGKKFRILQEQIDELRALLGGGTTGQVTNVTVNCPAESISESIASAPAAGTLIVTINGECKENVNIMRSLTTLLGGTNGQITGQTAGSAAVTVAGAQKVKIANLTLTQESGIEGDGVFATQNADVQISNSNIVDNRYGVWGRFGAFVRLINNDITRAASLGTTTNGAYGVLLTDSASTRMDGNRITVNLSPTFDEAAIGAFRDVAVRLSGQNIIRNNGNDGDPNTTGDNGVTVSLFHGVTFRQDGGHSSFTGDLNIGNVTNAAFRNSDITGDVGLFGSSTLQLRDQSRESDTPSTNVTLSGSIEVGGSSSLNIARRVILNSSINLESNSTLSIGDDSEINGNVRFATNQAAFVSRGVVINGNVEFIRSSYLDTDEVLNEPEDVVGMTINGNVQFHDSSTLNLSGGRVTINGNVFFFGRSSLFIGNENESKFVTITGDVEFQGVAGSPFDGNSTASFADSTTEIGGNVICNGGFVSGNPTFTGTGDFIGCNM